MSKSIKKAITILSIVIILTIVTISTFFIVKYINNKNIIEDVCKQYSDNNVQERLSDTNNKENDLTIQIDGEKVIGVITIEKIKFKGLVYEGTKLSTLEKGVGHFENSAYLQGNVCLAAHNYNKFWAKLHTLKKGDKITYISFLGTKEYEVKDITEISETDWSKLESTNENILTLITCIKNNPTKRLCVQASECN